MTVIRLETFIKAPPQTVFDLSRSVDLHKASMKHHGEKAIAGTRSGVMNKGDTVTWQAKHLFRNRTLKVRITEMQPPTFFADEMVAGDFQTMQHEHHFKRSGDGTMMIDLFLFKSPYGAVGTLFDFLFLKKYMRRLLLKRNEHIKRIAESCHPPVATSN